MCECLRRDDGTWHVDECCAHVMDEYHAGDPARPQPAPTGAGVEILPLVLRDLEKRAADGEKKYGTRLRSDNGRDALIDAYQEILDAAMYLRQRIEESDAGGWIRCSERMPDVRKVCLISTVGGEVLRAYCTSDGNWAREDGWLMALDPIAWQPLPEPYRGEP